MGLMELTHTLPMFHSDPAPVLTQSPRESFLTMDLVMLVTTMARDLLMLSQRLMLLTWAMDILMLMELMDAAHVPFGSSTGLDPITQGLDPVTQGAIPYYHAGYHYGK